MAEGAAVALELSLTWVAESALHNLTHSVLGGRHRSANLPPRSQTLLIAMYLCIHISQASHVATDLSCKCRTLLRRPAILSRRPCAPMACTDHAGGDAYALMRARGYAYLSVPAEITISGRKAVAGQHMGAILFYYFYFISISILLSLYF